MNFYIGDLHFGHANCVNFDHRPFADVEEMDRVLIKLWNGRVTAEDDIYILGDFAFRTKREYVWYLRQLKGRKHLVVGNHDEQLLQDEKAMGYFASVDKMMHVADVYQGARVQVCLCHYPIVSWNKERHGSWHIYGHIHNNPEDEARRIMARFDHALNAGCMVNNYTPCNFNELVRNNEGYRKKILEEQT